MIGEILNIGGKLIDRLWPDPETKAKAQAELMAMQQRGELAELSARYSAIVAEAKSSDPWTSRARPTFLYLIYLVILLCVFGGILGIWWPTQTTQAAENIKALLGAVPGELWTLFGAGYLGYSGARSYDKRQALKTKEAGL